ncbi:feruloyl esterase B-like [Jatropha curcas]|uniref:feruloyl esterase B-like n=1 Tax=Jatropha curcas TaxID=180498 RepID=UPI001894EEF9|nr:feruloyl esterase B-like [Jatropha curcas]
MANQGGYWGNNQGGNGQNGGWGNNQGPQILCGEGCTILIGPTQGGNKQCGSGNNQGGCGEGCTILIGPTQGGNKQCGSGNNQGGTQGGGWGNQTQGRNNQGGGYGYPQR